MQSQPFLPQPSVAIQQPAQPIYYSATAKNSQGMLW